MRYGLKKHKCLFLRVKLAQSKYCLYVDMQNERVLKQFCVLRIYYICYGASGVLQIVSVMNEIPGTFSNAPGHH